jgi:GNAT superfamily N-acetyltransferase
MNAPARLVRDGWPDDEPVAAETLALALEDDPVYRWIWQGDPEGPLAGLRAWMRLVLERLRGRAEVDVVGEDAAVVWIRPQAPLTGDDYAAVADLLAARIGDRAAEVMAVLGTTAPFVPDEPHRTLLYVGVRPLAQGRGIGSALLGPGLARADLERLPIYLTSTNPRNLPFYAKLGFEVLAAVPVADAAVMHPMWRPVR